MYVVETDGGSASGESTTATELTVVIYRSHSTAGTAIRGLLWYSVKSWRGGQLHFSTLKFLSTVAYVGNGNMLEW